MSSRTFCGAPPGQRQRAAQLRQMPEMARRRLALGHELVRILVAQLVERELHALEYRERLAQQLGGIPARELGERPQAALRVRPAARSRACRSAVLRRIAVSVSCSMRRSRQCMWTLPAATRGTPSSAPAARHSWSRRRSLPPRKSSAASQTRRSESLAQPTACREQRARARRSARRESRAARTWNPQCTRQDRRGSLDKSPCPPRAARG